MTIRCSSCGHEGSQYNDKDQYHDKSELNIRLVYGFRCIGKGEASAKTLFVVLNLPSHPPLPTRFSVYNAALCNTAMEVCLSSMRDAVEEEVG